MVRENLPAQVHLERLGRVPVLHRFVSQNGEKVTETGGERFKHAIDRIRLPPAGRHHKGGQCGDQPTACQSTCSPSRRQPVPRPGPLTFVVRITAGLGGHQYFWGDLPGPTQPRLRQGLSRHSAHLRVDQRAYPELRCAAPFQHACGSVQVAWASWVAPASVRSSPASWTAPSKREPCLGSLHGAGRRSSAGRLKSSPCHFATSCTRPTHVAAAGPHPQSGKSRRSCGSPSSRTSAVPGADLRQSQRLCRPGSRSAVGMSLG